METRTIKISTAFRLDIDLINRLKKLAKMENRSLNNYVETILIDAVYKKPNEETLEAMREATSGQELETLDLSDFKEFVASL